MSIFQPQSVWRALVAVTTTWETPKVVLPSLTTGPSLIYKKTTVHSGLGKDGNVCGLGEGVGVCCVCGLGEDVGVDWVRIEVWVWIG